MSQRAQRRNNRGGESGNKQEIGSIGVYSYMLAYIAAMFLALDPTLQQNIYLIYIAILVGGGTFSFLISNWRKGIQIDLANALQNIFYGIIFGGILVITTSIVSFAFSVWQWNLLVLMAPVSEEFFFRGFVLGLFLLNRSTIATILGLTFSSFAFAVFHFYVYNLVDPTFFIPLITAGIILGSEYIFTRSLDACIVSHFLNNALAI